ncbi:unnamed protein product [Symbiodinium sp. KB8]|nr:unnamed protein product [Symbiodinium sp. KB8]
MPMTGRIGLTTGANNGNGSLLQEIGTTGVFTGVAPGDVYGIGDQVRAAHAGAGDIRRFDQTPQAASLNLTVRQWGTSFDLFPRGIAKSVPDLVNNLQTVTPSHPPGAWTLETINRDASLVIGIDNIRINNRTEGKLKDLFASFSKHLREQGALNRVLNVRPGAAPLAAGTVPVEDWKALGRAIPIVAPWGASGAAPNAIAQCGAGSYSHFEETVFGTQNALQGFPNGPAYIANGGPVINNAVPGACPGGCVINALVVTRDPTAPAALTAHAGIPGAVVPNGRAGNGNTDRAGAAALARGERPLFLGLFPHNASLESTLNVGVRTATLMANAIIKSAGRTIGGWDHTPPYTLDAHKVLKWVTDTVQAPAGLGSAFARNYVSFNHSLGGTSGFPEHDAAKFIVVLGWAQKDAHRRRETDSVLQGMQQSLRNLATDLYNAAHACPHLFLAALKSGSHPTKCGLCVPVFGFRLGGGFSNFDKLRSKDVLVPESKAFVSYLQEMLKICDRNKASALLATEMDIGHLRSIVKEELRRGWLGHSKVMSWKDTAIGDVLWGDGGNCTWGGALHVFIDIFIDNVFVDDVQPLSVSALYVFGVSVIVPGFDVVA